jgi:hypothetical protein
MPFWGYKNLLQLDFNLRDPNKLKLFRCPKGKNIVVSDTTIERVLKWLDPQESRTALLMPFNTLSKKGLLRRRLVSDGPVRRLGVFDGSQMGKHYLVAGLLCGKSNYPFLVEPCQGRGHELKTTQRLITVAHKLLLRSAPKLWLLDALYFNQPSFKTVREQKAHILIKYSPRDDKVDTKLFRDILEDAKALFSVRSKTIDPVAEKHGFDSERWCSWSMKKTSADFAGFPVNIFFLVEDYPKKKKNAHSETWIVTTDLTLTFEEAREAAHLRWLCRAQDYAEGSRFVNVA